jgi:GAF domain-containing protein
MPENSVDKIIDPQELSEVPKATKRSVFRNLMISMISFGILVGLVFPIFARIVLDIPQALSLQFFLMCIIAGFLVGLGENLIFKRTVSREITLIISEMNGVMVFLQASVGKSDAQAPKLNVTSADSIGEIQKTFNLLTNVVIKRTRELEASASALEAASTISQRLSTIHDIRQLVLETAQQLQQTFNYYHVNIYLYDPEKEFLVLTGGTGEAGKILLSQGHKIPRGKGLVGRASEKGIAVLISDTSKDNNWLPNPLLPETKSEIAAPIIFGDEVLGALDVQQNLIYGLTNNDIDLLRSVSSQLAVAIRNARLYESIEKRAENERVINLIMDQVQSTSSIENAVQVVTSELEKILNVTCSFIKSGLKTNIDDENGIFALPIYVHDVEIGELVISGHVKLDDFSSRLVHTVVDRLSVHLEKLQLSIQNQQALAETDALLSITAELNAAQEFQDVLSAITTRTILRDANQSLMMCLFDRPFRPGQIPEWVFPVAYKVDLPVEIAERYPLSAFEVKPNTIFTSQIVIIKDVATDPRMDRITRKLFQNIFHSNSSIIVPLVLADQSLGFVMGNFDKLIDFTEVEIQRLSAIAGQVAITVQGLQLLKQTQARVKREQLLREVTEQINNATSTDVVLYRAAQELGRVLKQQVIVYLGKDIGS